jgi:serine/threonine protein kinase
VAVLGLPNENTLKAMSKQIKEHHISLVHKLDEMPARNFETLIPKSTDYEKNWQEVKEAADLIAKMLCWVPKDRISCEDALKHRFLKE